MSKEQVVIGGIPIEIVRKANLKNMYLRVFPPDGDVRVSCSIEFKDEEIRLFILNKLPEINKVRERMLSQPRQSKREFVSGESYYLWGKPYRLQVVYKGNKYTVAKKPNKILLTVPENTSEEQREKVMTEWYRQEMKRALEGIIASCEKKTGIKADEYRIKNMKTRWGTCNIAKRRVWLNLQLVKKPVICLEYVLIHELTHLVEKNHTHRFYSLVEEFCPSWKEARKLLATMPLDHIEKGERDTDGETSDMERCL